MDEDESVPDSSQLLEKLRKKKLLPSLLSRLAWLLPTETPAPAAPVRELLTQLQRALYP